MISSIRDFLGEPRLPAGPRRTRWDYALLISLGTLMVLGVPFEEEVLWRPVAAVLGAVFLAALWWRRSHPLLAVAVAFGLQLVAEVIAYFAADGSPLLGSSFLAGVILIYAVWRWGSGREAVAGLLLTLIAMAVADVNLGSPRAEAIGSAAIFTLGAAIGATVRSQVKLRQQTISEARLSERERLARELHDTVAHHVSAIAVQAQAGQAVIVNDPDRGREVLGTIEDVANLTLDEMRRMVGVLRADAEDQTRPPEVTGLAGIQRLVDSAVGPEIVLDLSGDLDDLDPSLAAGLYRLVQESITNARRHSRSPSVIRVVIRGTDDDIQLSVVDDGAPAPSPTEGAGGFGLVGMAERASVLGGSFDANPGSERGWVVTATLPRDPANQ